MVRWLAPYFTGTTQRVFHPSGHPNLGENRRGMAFSEPLNASCKLKIRDGLSTTRAIRAIFRPTGLDRCKPISGKLHLHWPPVSSVGVGAKGRGVSRLQR